MGGERDSGKAQAADVGHGFLAARRPELLGTSCSSPTVAQEKTSMSRAAALIGHLLCSGRAGGGGAAPWSCRLSLHEQTHLHPLSPTHAHEYTLRYEHATHTWDTRATPLLMASQRRQVEALTVSSPSPNPGLHSRLRLQAED